MTMTLNIHVLVQVCLMSQSWNIMANMHELFTENLISLAVLYVSQWLGQCACQLAAAARTLNLLVLLHRPHPSMQVNSSCSNSPLQWRGPRSIKSTTRLWRRTDLVSRFTRGSVACWAGLSKRAVLRPVRLRMHLYGHPCLCTRHCNSDQSWAFWTYRRTHLLCPPG